MEFILKLNYLNVSKEDMLLDMKRVARLVLSTCPDKRNRQSMTICEYDALGRYSSHVIINKFTSWNNALTAAGLIVNKVNTLTKEDLLEDMEIVWRKLNRQPMAKDMVKPMTAYSLTTYTRHFGSWRGALIAFVDHMKTKNDGSDTVRVETKNGHEKASCCHVTCGEVEEKIRKRTNKHVSASMRFKILARDKFKCRLCGASPATNPEIVLHVDHIIPYSKGGLTVEENLWTICSNCNYGKGTKTIDYE